VVSSWAGSGEGILGGEGGDPRMGGGEVECRRVVWWGGDDDLMEDEDGEIDSDYSGSYLAIMPPMLIYSCEGFI
jgi:hypothetical protein